ncbi:MAG: diguanylate cyclase [Gammaproteobacteria bacterium]|nr:diguanylate cyclase [Gammaproteobacteria bacterium]
MQQETNSATQITATRWIAAGFALTVLLMTSLVFFGLSRLNLISDTVDGIVNTELAAIESIYAMHSAARERSLVLNDITNTSDPFERDEMTQRFTELAGTFGEARRRLLNLPLSDKEKALLEKQRQFTNAAIPLQSQVIELVQTGKVDAAQRQLALHAVPAQNRVITVLKELLDQELDKSEVLAQKVHSERQHAHVFMISSGAGAILLTIAILFLVNRRMSGLVSQLMGTTGQLRIALKDIEYEKLAMDKHAIVSIADADGRITYVNEMLTKACGYSQGELIGQNHRLFKSDYHPPAFFEEMWKTILRGNVWQGELCNRAKDGSDCWMATTIVPFLDDTGRPYQYVAIRTDITKMKDAEKILLRDKEQLETLIQQRAGELAQVNKNLLAEIKRRQELEEDLRTLASTDKLTSILNRRALDDALRKEIERARRYRHPMALILFDIDHFKHVNDTFGHQVGDTVLSELARLVTGKIRVHDVFARWGGEEFVILGVSSDMDGCLRLAEKLRGIIENHPFPGIKKATCSFGVTVLRDDDTAVSLIKRVDEALYSAKQSGRNRVQAA